MKLTTLAIVGTLILSQLAHAELGEKKTEKWRKDHPRQAEVNGRLQNQQNRVQQGVKNDTMTQSQVNKVDNQDHKIYNEEQRMKVRDGSNSITPAQQAKLNRQENAVSKEIRNDKAANAAAAPAAPVTPPTSPNN